MNINFLQRELNTDKLEAPQIRVAYLIAICEQYPILWAQFKQLIEYVEEQVNKEVD